MPLTVIRREGQDDELAAWLDRAAGELGCRAGDVWTLVLEAQPQGHVLVATGPYRSRRAACAGATSRDAEGTCGRYPLALGTASEWTTGTMILRFGVWNGEDDGPRYLCKIESVPSAAADAPPAWRWWSPLVRTPVELAGPLCDAISSRERQPLDRRATNERQFWGWAAIDQAGA